MGEKAEWHRYSRVGWYREVVEKEEGVEVVEGVKGVEVPSVRTLMASL